jgi:hypothetical protein
MIFSQYLSKYVFHLMPIFGVSAEETYEQKGEMFETNVVDYPTVFEDYPTTKLKHNYSFLSKSKIWEVNNLFDLCYGRMGALWVPSWKRDFKLSSNITANQSIITIDDVQYPVYFPVVPGTGRHLFIYDLVTNQGYTRKVDSVASGNILTLNSAIPIALQAERSIISILYLCRFDIDELEWSYYGPEGNAEITIDFIELPKEYA